MHLIVTAVDWLEPDAVRLRALQQAELPDRCSDVEPGAKPREQGVAVFLLGRDRLTGAAVTCGGLRPLEPGTAEIERLYVVPEQRGQGLSRVMLAELEREAAALGWCRLRIETGPRQHEAIGLCTGAGYRRIPGFGAHRDAEHSLCFEKYLESGCADPAGAHSP